MPVPAQALVQQGKGVLQSAVRDPGDQQGCVVVQLGAFFSCHVLQPACDGLGGNALEVEALAPGQNGGQQLVDFGGCQNEDHMGRGFLQRF